MVYQFFPRSQKPTAELLDVYACFHKLEKDISSKIYEKQESNVVLAKIAGELKQLGFSVEDSKKQSDLIVVPVLYGKNGKVEKKFYADALSADGTIVIEVEAGRAVLNNQFLKDIFQASMMQEVEYLVLAIRESYKGRNDFNEVYTFLDTLYTSNKIRLPLKGILIIGY